MLVLLIRSSCQESESDFLPSRKSPDRCGFQIYTILILFYELEAINETQKAFVKATNKNADRSNLSYFFGILKNIQRQRDEEAIRQYCRKRYNYRLVADYRLYGLWAVIPARCPGKQSPCSELQLAIILDKLKHPKWSPETIIKTHKLNVSRFSVHRVIKRWGLEDKHRNSVALDEYLGQKTPVTEEPFQPLQSAYHLQSEKSILSKRRINRHFDLICNKMRIRPFQICGPGPFLLAPFVNELAVVQAFDAYGPMTLRGKEISNLRRRLLSDFKSSILNCTPIKRA